MIHVVGNVAIVVTTLLAWAFCLLYHLLAPWRASTMGRHAMTFVAGIAAVLTLTCVRLAFGLDAPWFQALRLVVFLAVPASLAWRIAILLRVQRRDRR